jgi:hypothetical protein
MRVLSCVFSFGEAAARAVPVLDVGTGDPVEGLECNAQVAEGDWVWDGNHPWKFVAAVDLYTPALRLRPAHTRAGSASGKVPSWFPLPAELEQGDGRPGGTGDTDGTVGTDAAEGDWVTVASLVWRGAVLVRGAAPTRGQRVAYKAPSPLPEAGVRRLRSLLQHQRYDRRVFVAVPA